jgi:ABC-type sugar transport system substrate-binding protein
VKRARAGLMLVVAMVALVAGCGDDSDGSQSTASAGKSGIAVEKKTIGVVSLGLGSPIANAHADLLKAAGAQLGWEVLVTDGAYDPAKIGGAVQSYVDRKVDAIITESSEADVMRSGLLAAKREGIPVIGTVGGVLPNDLFTAQYMEDESKMGELGAEAIKEAIKDPKVANLKVSAASSGVDRDKALKATLDPGSIVDEHDIDLGNPVDSTQRAVDAAVSRHLDINAVYAVYDTLLQPSETMLKRKGSDAKTFSYFATPDNLKRLKSSSNPLEAVIANNVAKAGLVAIDQVVAHFEKGTEIDPDALEKDPLEYVILTKQNLEDKLGGRGELFPNAQILAPFVKRWQQEYPAA